MEPEPPASLDDVDLDVFGSGEQTSAALDGKAARREAQLSANIKVGYRAPRGVKPHGWLGSATMMSVEAWISCVNWTVLYGFHQSLFWHFTGARAYSDVLCTAEGGKDGLPSCPEKNDTARRAVGAGCAVACAVVFLPIVLEIPPVLRFVTGRHNLLTLATTLLLSATVIADAMPDAEGLRTTLLGAGSATVMLSMAAVASCPAVNPRLRRQPWAVVLGLLTLLCFRFGRATAHPLLQAEGSRTLAIKVLLCAAALCCALVIIREGKGCCAKERTPEEGMNKLKKELNKLERQYAQEGKKLSSELARVSMGSAPSPNPSDQVKENRDYRKVYSKYATMRSKLQLYKTADRDHDYGRDTRAWLWLLVGPALASSLALTLWLFTSAGLIGRIVGVPPFRHSAALLFLAMSLGLCLNGLLTMHGVLLQCWASIFLTVGTGLLLHGRDDAGYAGGVLVLPAFSLSPPPPLPQAFVPASRPVR